MPGEGGLLHVVRGAVELEGDRRFLERWQQASAKPDEVVLVPLAEERAKLLPAVSWPGLAVRPSTGEVDFFAVAGEAIRGSSCEWVSFSLGEGALLPERLTHLRERLAADDRAWACWFGEDVPEMEGDTVAIQRLADLIAAPPGECLVFRRRRLLELGGLEPARGALAPWAAFLAAAEHGPVHVIREDVASNELPRGVRGAPRALDAVLLQARWLGGWLTPAQQLTLVGIVMRQLGDPRGLMNYATQELAPGYCMSLVSVSRDKPDVLPAAALRKQFEQLADSWKPSWGPTRPDCPIWHVTQPNGSGPVVVTTGTHQITLGTPCLIADRKGAELRLRRGDYVTEESGRRRYRGEAWVDIEAQVPVGKLLRVRLVMESMRPLRARFSWDDEPSLVQLRFPFNKRFRARVQSPAVNPAMVRLSTDDDRVVYDCIAFSHPYLPPDERFFASPREHMSIGIYSDESFTDFYVDRITVESFEHEGFLYPQGFVYAFAATEEEFLARRPSKKAARSAPQ